MAQEHAEQYQWVKGDLIGNNEIFAQTKDDWVYFQSGRRIKSELLSEFMLPISDNTPLQPLQNNTGPTVHKRIETNPGSPGSPGAPGVKSGYSFQDENTDDVIRDAHGQVQQAPQINIPEPQVNPNIGNTPTASNIPKKEINPVVMLLNQSKKDKIILDIKVEIELPKPNVYEIIKDSFEVDLNEEIIKNILEKFDNKELKEKFKISLEEKLKIIYK